MNDLLFARRDQVQAYNARPQNSTYLPQFPTRQENLKQQSPTRTRSGSMPAATDMSVMTNERSETDRRRWSFDSKSSRDSQSSQSDRSRSISTFKLRPDKLKCSSESLPVLPRSKLFSPPPTMESFRITSPTPTCLSFDALLSNAETYRSTFRSEKSRSRAMREEELMANLKQLAQDREDAETQGGTNSDSDTSSDADFGSRPGTFDFGDSRPGTFDFGNGALGEDPWAMKRATPGIQEGRTVSSDSLINTLSPGIKGSIIEEDNSPSARIARTRDRIAGSQPKDPEKPATACVTSFVEATMDGTMKKVPRTENKKLSQTAPPRRADRLLSIKSEEHHDDTSESIEAVDSDSDANSLVVGFDSSDVGKAFVDPVAPHAKDILQQKQSQYDPKRKFSSSFRRLSFKLWPAGAAGDKAKVMGA